jgi:carboxyl-terminal processing protease
MNATVISGITLFASFASIASALGQDEIPTKNPPLPILSAADGTTAQLVTKLITARHILHPAIDDALSEGLVKRFIQSWDSEKRYFLKPDILEFETQKASLDDQLHAGNPEFANSVFKRFYQRAAERFSRVDSWIDADHDFTANESLNLEPKEIDWATTVAELDERWRKHVKYELLLLKLKGYDIKEARLRLRRQYVRTQALIEQTEPHELLERFLTSLTKCIDARAEYWSEESMAKYESNGARPFGTLGLSLKERDGYLVVEEIVSGSAAAIDGRIRKGDRLLAVADDPTGDFIELWHLKSDAIRRATSGPIGKTIRVEVLKHTGLREGYSIKLASTKSVDVRICPESTIISSSEWIEGTGARIGIIRVPEFHRTFFTDVADKEFESTAREIRAILGQFNAENVDAAVVDLRGNTGGPMQDVLDACAEFIGDGPVVQTREPDDSVFTSHQSDVVEINWQKPLIVICDRYTASSAELFPAAIQDYHRGLVIGDSRTNGRGSLQAIYAVTSERSRLRSHGSVRLTAGGYFRVNGRCIQKSGVESDILLPSLTDHTVHGEESQENAISFDSTMPAQYTPFKTYLSGSIVTNLVERSRARVQNNPDFNRVQDQIQHLSQKLSATVSLNHQMAKMQMNEQRSKGGTPDANVAKLAGMEIFARNYYNTEVLHITTDYLHALKSIQTIAP